MSTHWMTGKWSAAVLIAAGVGCSAAASEADLTAALEREPTAESAAAFGSGELGARFADGAVAGCLTAANKGEILQAEAVRDRLTDPAARRYAEAMVEMHTDALTTDKEAFAAAGIQALPSLGAAVLTADSALITKALVKAPEAKVDLVYAESQVVVHGRVLFAVENELAPKARGEVTQARLRAARDMVKAHLEEAKALYETLKGNNAP